MDARSNQRKRSAQSPDQYSADGGGNLRPLPRATQREIREMGAGPVAPGDARDGYSACKGRLLAGWPNARCCGGVQLRSVQTEQDVCGRRDLQQVPRPSQWQAENCG